MAYEGWGPTSDRRRGSTSTHARRERASARESWWQWNDHLRFYGLFLLLTTKTADAATTAVGLRFVPGIVERNPFADTVFVASGTVTGLVVLSFATVAVATLTAEWLAVSIYRRFHMARAALLSKATIYGLLSLLFGAIAVNNALLISAQVRTYLAELLVLSG